MLFVERPYTQGNADLRVIAFRTANDGIPVIQQLVQPFFYYGFSITTGNAYYRQVELFAVPGYQRLQCLQRIGDLQNIGAGQVIGWDCFAYYKIANAFFVQGNNKG